MNKKDLPKKLRMLLYGNVDSNELSQQFERLLDLCGCEYCDIEIVESETMILVDIPDCIQYIKVKKPKNRIYEVIPKDSPLRSKEHDRRKSFRDKPQPQCGALRLQMQNP
jgi:hypothetical protein